MTHDRDSESCHPILDDMALDAIARPIEQLREELEEAGIDITVDITKFRRISQSAISEYQARQINELPDVVPEDAKGISQLLERLLTVPEVANSNLMVGFRNLENLTVNDERELTISLLELVKTKDDS